MSVFVIIIFSVEWVKIKLVFSRQVKKNFKQQTPFAVKPLLILCICSVCGSAHILLTSTQNVPEFLYTAHVLVVFCDAMLHL